VTAPGRGRRGKVGKSSLSRISHGTNGRAGGDDVEEVLFDGTDGMTEGGIEIYLEEEGRTLVAESRSQA
jgi:hypothetical protein